MNAPYFKLAVWDRLNLCFRDGKPGYPSEAAAKAHALLPGRYRISRVDDTVRSDLEPFEIVGDPHVLARRAGFNSLPTATSLVFGRRWKR